MQKPTIPQQRIMNAMNSGAALVFHPHDVKLYLYGPGGKSQRLQANQAFNMERRGLISVRDRPCGLVEYGLTEAAKQWALENGL
jgi:hypothetical protein